jgi:hypothetical protein
MPTIPPLSIPAPQAAGSAIRLVHAALLLQGGIAMAREFWSGHPLETRDEPLVGASLHAHVWKEDSRYPLEWVLRVLGSLESFCLRYGLDYLEFLEQRVLGLNGGSLLSPRASLRFAGRFLGSLLHSPDIRLTTLRLLDEASKSAPAGGLVAKLLRHERSGDRLTAWIRLDAASSTPGLAESDICFWVATALAQAPRRWGAERFEEVETLADMRSIEGVISATQQVGAPTSSSRGWRHRGKQLSSSVPLRDWLVEEGLAADLPDAPDGLVVQRIEEDWICPQRGRLVLRRGSVLGAPWGLFRIRWSLDDTSPIVDALSRLFLEATDDEESHPSWSVAHGLHADLLESDRHRLRFVYHTTDETISCNGSHLLRGVPAKILQKVLLAHTVTGRTIFEHREFRRDPDLNLDPANPNLESRLRLLAQRLEERLPALRLAKAGRGRFQMESSIQIEYTEENGGT